MVDIRGPDWEKIKEEYIKLNGNVKLKEFAEKYGVKYSTLRSRKNRENWDNDINKNVATKNATQQKNVATKNKNKNNDKEPVVQEVKEVLENTELTDKQRLFCVYYIKYFNATKAYQKAYNSSYIVANSEGYKLLVNPCIKAEIEKLKQYKLNQIMLSEEDIFQRYMDIAFSDIGDYLSFKKVRKNKWTKNKDGEDIPVINPDTGEQDYYEYNVVELNNSKELDTSILQEVSEGKEGVKIKLQDKMKALQWLSDRLDLLPIETRIKLNNEKDKINIDREKLELEKSKVTGNDEEVQDDGFIQALEGKAEEVWENEE